MIWKISLALCVWSSFAFSQDLQTRIVARPVIDITENYYLSSWIVGNARLHTTNNINIFPGVGYRTKRWWTEVSVQRQWSRAGNNWMLDFRFQKQLTPKNSLYIEFSPFLTKRSYYHFVIYERRVWKKLNWRTESENIQWAGLDSWNGGAGPSLQIATFGPAKLTSALVYRFHRRERDILRLYVALSRK